MPPPEPEQPRGQDELERRLPGYQRIVIPRDLTLIELLVSTYLNKVFRPPTAIVTRPRRNELWTAVTRLTN